MEINLKFPTYAEFLKNEGSWAKIVNSDRKRLIPLMNNYLYTVEPEDMDNTTQKIVDFYFGTKDIGEDTALKFVEVTSTIFDFKS